MRVSWILPATMAHRELRSGQKDQGMEVTGDGMQLTIYLDSYAPQMDLSGIYHCSLLLQLTGSNGSEMAWHYLKWGFQVYKNEPSLLSSPSISK
ncbi:unnamed protein product [Protopolystoma xenopodis]|uniref:Ig-like domain-containing protein n=1 Tax=Protopolystoma xenopodis TaxID=117903 RepID=A0A448X740_9PLAT|nr:unnamed protein product [Protopolystoma xenopodis]